MKFILVTIIASSLVACSATVSWPLPNGGSLQFKADPTFKDFKAIKEISSR